MFVKNVMYNIEIDENLALYTFIDVFFKNLISIMFFKFRISENLQLILTILTSNQFRKLVIISILVLLVFWHLYVYILYGKLAQTPTDLSFVFKSNRAVQLPKF